MPVLFYHAKLGCTGGFVGVDVFFVISGFVISSLILKELAEGTFSMVNFWERRIRRILPALSLVVAAVLVTGWLLFLPEDFRKLGSSVMAQSVMSANFYFWKGGTNYFAHSFDTKPLLHIWSLAVEEQFYLVFPLLLAFLFRARPRSLRHWILGIAAGSLVLSVLGSYSSNNHRSTFFLLPSRIWELLAGVLLALNRGRFPTTTLMRESSGFLGLALIAWSVFAYDDDTRFPGLAALPPCLGAALIIASSEARSSITGRLLSFKPFVFIGLVSYPLYLWHWPLLTYTTYLSGHELSAKTHNQVLLTGLLLASFLLAVLTWKFVETPFRQRRWFGERRQIFKFAGITTGVFLALGFVVNYFHGFPTRFSAKALALSKVHHHTEFQEEIGLERVKAGQFMELGSAKSSQPISLLVWGDSHAKSVAPALDDLCREYSLRGVLSAYSSVPPLLNYVIKRPEMLRDMTPQVAEGVVDFIAQHHIKKVLLAARWNRYATTAGFKAALIQTVRTLMNSGAHVYVLKQVHEPGFDVARIAALTTLHGGDLDALGSTKEHHQKSDAELGPTFEQLAQMGATVLDSSDLFLTSRGNYRIIKDGKLLFFDSNHLTLQGATVLTPLFMPLFQTR